MSANVTEPEAPWAAGLRGARANFVPGLALQAIALALVLAYYFHPPTQHLLGQLAAFRERSGLIYSCLSTALFGGVLPCLYLELNPSTRGRYRATQIAAIIAFWAYKGIEVDYWYRALAWIAGDGPEFGTVAAKMAIDQFLYTPLFALPTTWLLYAWAQNGFNGRAVLDDYLAPRWFIRRILPIYIPNLVVWGPAVCIIYSLPISLQLPLNNLVLCFFTLLLAYLTEHRPRAR